MLQLLVTILDPWRFGQWGQACNNFYLFTDKTVNLRALETCFYNLLFQLAWKDAKCLCEKYSMKIANVESISKLSCLTEISSSKKFYNNLTL